MRFKRIISAITGMAVLASSMSVLSGCSMKEFFSKDESSSGAADDGVISNGEWLAMVNDAFGMQVDETSETGELDVEGNIHGMMYSENIKDKGGFL